MVQPIARSGIYGHKRISGTKPRTSGYGHASGHLLPSYRSKNRLLARQRRMGYGLDG